ncbi:hypothetical protein G6F42_025694 [Rhizopus arrhizus]|nr:hypothetical protein G6F42_025694 [Rhizopus arrhizus]
MPTKPVDSRKLKNAGAAGPSGSKEKRAEKEKNAPPPPGNPSVGIYDAKRAKTRRNKKKSYRRFLSLSLATYLGYTFFYACGSPFDETSDKPAICGAIDPIKLDLYKVYQSDYYQSNIDPHVAPIVSKISGIYNDYGVPAQVKVVSLYDQYGRPRMNEGCVRASQFQDPIAALLPRSIQASYPSTTFCKAAMGQSASSSEACKGSSSRQGARTLLSRREH